MSKWPLVQLSEVAEVERDSIQASAIEGGTLYVGLENIVSGGAFFDVREVAEGELASSKFHFTPSHLLYGKLRPYLAKIARPSFSGICSTDILPVLPGAKLSRDYLSHYLRQQEMVDLANARASGANLPRLSPKTLAAFKIPLPPLAEQRRIAAILDQAETLRAQRRAAIAQLDSLGQAIFLEMFGGSGTPEPTVGELLQSKALLLHKDGNHGSMYPLAEDFGSVGVPFLSARCISDEGEIRNEMIDRLRDHKAVRLKLGWTEKNDVLLAHNASVGKVALYDGRFEKALIGTSLTAFRADPKVLSPRFLAAVLRSDKFQRQLRKNMAQTTRNQVPITAQRELNIVLPPVSQQKIFATRQQSIAHLESKHRAALAGLDELFASLQHRAFRGEL